GPLAYLVIGVYGLYTDWHPPALSTPWIWPARPPHDVGGALCAAVVFAAGLVAVTLRGARERPGGDGLGKRTPAGAPHPIDQGGADARSRGRSAGGRRVRPRRSRPAGYVPRPAARRPGGSAPQRAAAARTGPVRMVRRCPRA